jgi:hypothetical protein
MLRPLTIAILKEAFVALTDRVNCTRRYTTQQISIQALPGCCTYFVPENVYRSPTSHKWGGGGSTAIPIKAVVQLQYINNINKVTPEQATKAQMGKRFVASTLDGMR